MNKEYHDVDDLLVEDLFLAWYYKQDESKVAQFEEWLKLNPSNKPIVAEAVAVLNGFMIEEKLVAEEQTEQALSRLKNKLREESQEAKVVSLPAKRNKWWIPAAAVLLLIAGYLYWSLEAGKEVLQTNYGSIAEHQLPDGSAVLLNAHSQIEIEKGWSKGKAREVWLKGEAFFRVTKTPEQSKFIVHTEVLDIVVTGTQFNVTARNNKVGVLLTEGSVTVRTKEGQEIAMKPGEYVEWNNRMVQKKKEEEKEVLAWKDRKMLFEKTPMSEVASLIKEHYGVDVEFADPSLKEKTVSGILPNDNLEVLLQAIEATTEYKIIRKENKMVITHP